MLTIIADSNIAHLYDYFNEQVLQQSVNVIAMAGRDIDASVLQQHQPDALLIRSVTQINAQLLANNDSIKFIGSATIGTDHVDQSYLSQRGIPFANAAGCSKHSVAQYVMTAILSLRPQYWSVLNNQNQSSALGTAAKLGIIGLGNIGSTLAKYALDLGWQVLGYDPLLPTSALNNASFEQVLTQSDVISLHVPLTLPVDSPYPTYHLIDRAALAKIPESTLIINSARGPVISEADLFQAFEGAKMNATKRQVVLDVFEHEPMVPAKLLEQLTLATPHIAGYSLEGKLRGTQIIFEQFLKVFDLPFSAKNESNTASLMTQLLPDNPYHWQRLKQMPQKLAEYYDIEADDRLLRGCVNPKSQAVVGADFDALRKNYKLRREWQFED